MKFFRVARLQSAAVLAIAVAVCVASGCGTAEEPRTGTSVSAPAAPASIRVAAASDLRVVLPALISEFKRKTQIDVIPSFDSSGHLSEQIRAGAPFDVFLAANQSFVKKLADEKLIVAESVQPYALGTLVLAVHRESGGSIQGLGDLAKAEIKKIAIANPAFAPYGAAGKQALERANLWKSLEPKIVQAESVAQALQFIQSGNAEAGLVGKAVAGVPEVRTIAVDPKLYEPLIQALGVVAASSRSEAAREFAEFVAGPEGQNILKNHGFGAIAKNNEKAN